MSAAKRLCPRILLSAALLLALALALLWARGDLGLRGSSLEGDARASQQIPSQWLAAGETGEELAAMVFYPPDRSDHTFSVYWKRPGLSLGYFFRGGGSLSLIDRGIACFSVENCPQKAYLSLNRPGIAQVVIDDGSDPRAIPLDPEKPFALVLPRNAGTVTFLDEGGRPVQPQEQPL